MGAKKYALGAIRTRDLSLKRGIFNSFISFINFIELIKASKINTFDFYKFHEFYKVYIFCEHFVNI